MRIDIGKLTENRLIELNHRIVERLKFLDSMPLPSRIGGTYSTDLATVRNLLLKR